MKVVNLWVGGSFVGAFLPHQQLHNITPKTVYATFGDGNSKNLPEASHRRIHTENPTHGNPSSATADTHSNPCERSRAFWHVGKAMSELQGSL